jgi:hypothetical protein
MFRWLSDLLGIVPVTMWLISLFSSINERLLSYIACLAILGTSFFFARLLSNRFLKFVLPTLTSFVTFTTLYMIFPAKYTFYVDGHLFPGDTLTTDHPILVALSLTLLVALDRLSLWLGRENKKPAKASRLNSTWFVLLLVPALAVLLLNGWSLRGLARTLHGEPAVQQFAIGDFNGLELDLDHRRLFACGHGTDYLLAYEISALDKKPHNSQVAIGKAWSFAYNAKEDEIYIMDSVAEDPPPKRQVKTLRILDGTTLTLKKVFSNLGVGSGDAWVTWDRYTGHIIIASEDPDHGVPIIALDRLTGHVVYTLKEITTNTLLNPHKPLLYMTEPVSPGEPDAYKLLAFDTSLRRISATFGPERQIFERMAMRPDGSELFVAGSSESSVLRFDSETLELKGRIKTSFGVRTLAVDPMRNLVITGSLFSNMLEVIDIETQLPLATYYIGPWLRTIVVDPARGSAYVSSKEGLFKVDYIAKIPSARRSRS